MKTYSGKGHAKKNKRLYVTIIASAMAVIALTVTLIALSGGGNVPDVDAVTPGGETITPTPDTGTVVDPDAGADADVNVPVDASPRFTLPVENGSVIRACSLNGLVYMPSLNMWKTHNGIDFAADKDASVLSVSNGKVLSVETTSLEGVVVTVEHDGGLVSVYKSLSASSVNVGATVSVGDKIGVAGTMLTESSDGIHVHLEMKKNGALVDPAEYIGTEVIK